MELFGINFTNNSQKQITATVINRGANMGTWTGTSYQYSELTKLLKSTNIMLVIDKKSG